MAASEPHLVIVEFMLLPDVSKGDAKALLVQNAGASYQDKPRCLRFDVVERHDNEAAFGEWELALLDDLATEVRPRSLLAEGRITDLLLVITFEGVEAPWHLHS